MNDTHWITRLLAQRRPGYSLPQPFYVSKDIYEFDLEAIFHRTWMMVGFEAELKQPGSFISTEIGRSPIIVLRDTAGAIVGFHNSCRHRGAQIVPTGAGRLRRLVCPYHQWSYDLDGRLLSCRGAPDDFKKEAHGLAPIRVETVAGCIYVTLSHAAPDFAPFRSALDAALRPHNLQALKVAHVETLHERGNWKLAMENARECHHCQAAHPEFVTAVPVDDLSATLTPGASRSDLFFQRMKELGIDTTTHVADWWQIGRIPMKEGYVSFSLDGKPLVKKPLTQLGNGDLGSLRWAIEPNNFCHVTSDCVFMFNANPTGPLTTTVTAKWLVHEHAVEGEDYEVSRLIQLWSKTNAQDQQLVENNQRGVNGLGYVPGPYSPADEPFVMRFADWYCSKVGEFLSDSRTGVAAQQ
jgi:Rieske 2Fe-2S family protein